MRWRWAGSHQNGTRRANWAVDHVGKTSKRQGTHLVGRGLDLVGLERLDLRAGSTVVLLGCG